MEEKVAPDNTPTKKEFIALSDRVMSAEGKIRILSEYQSAQQRNLEAAIDKLTEVAKCLKENEDAFGKALAQTQAS